MFNNLESCIVERVEELSDKQKAGKLPSGGTDNCAVINIDFDIDDARNTVEILVDRIHSEVEHEY